MLMSKRHLILAGTAAMAGGTVAVATAMRKPPPVIHVLTPDMAVATVADGVSLQNATTMVVTSPPRPAADIVFKDAAGHDHRLTEFAGHGVVINLWATWCPPCVAELPALARMAALVADDGIVVLPLSSDRGGAEKVQSYFQTHNITGLGVLLDPHGEAARGLGARGVPTTIVIDRQGRERGRLEGPADWAANDLLRLVRSMAG